MTSDRKCNHWPGQDRCEVCGMNNKFEVRLQKEPIRAAAITVEAIENMQRNIDYWGRRAEKAEGKLAGFKSAVERMLIGGNHLATYRTNDWPHYAAEPAVALERLGAGREYDMWCCWAAIMRARDSLAEAESRPLPSTRGTE